MSIFTSVIKQVESEFDDIYRIMTENGLVLDIHETKKPAIGSKIIYRLRDVCVVDTDFDYTIMNGIVFGTNNIGILVSFGGLLGTIPLDDSIKKSFKEEICLSYKLGLD
jgi:hypothetical protein